MMTMREELVFKKGLKAPCCPLQDLGLVDVYVHEEEENPYERCGEKA